MRHLVVCTSFLFFYAVTCTEPSTSSASTQAGGTSNATSSSSDLPTANRQIDSLSIFIDFLAPVEFAQESRQLDAATIYIDFLAPVEFVMRAIGWSAEFDNLHLPTYYFNSIYGWIMPVWISVIMGILGLATRNGYPSSVWQKKKIKKENFFFTASIHHKQAIKKNTTSSPLLLSLPATHQVATIDEPESRLVGPDTALNYVVDQIEELPASSSAELGGFMKDYTQQMWQTLIYILRNLLIRAPTQNLQTRLSALEYFADTKHVGPQTDTTDKTFVVALANPFQSFTGKALASIFTPLAGIFGLAYQQELIAPSLPASFSASAASGSTAPPVPPAPIPDADPGPPRQFVGAGLMNSLLRIAASTQQHGSGVHGSGIDTADVLLNWMGIDTNQPDLADTSISIGLGRLSSAFALPFLLIAPFIPLAIPFMFTTLCDSRLREFLLMRGRFCFPSTSELARQDTPVEQVASTDNTGRQQTQNEVDVSLDPNIFPFNIFSGLRISNNIISSILRVVSGVELHDGAGEATFEDGMISINLGDGGSLRIPRGLAFPMTLLAPLSPLVSMVAPLAVPAMMIAGGSYLFPGSLGFLRRSDIFGGLFSDGEDNEANNAADEYDYGDYSDNAVYDYQGYQEDQRRRERPAGRPMTERQRRQQQQQGVRNPGNRQYSSRSLRVDRIASYVKNGIKKAGELIENLREA
ncbi:unnamed protein product [Cyprideis torosa]|uniref:Uncharacterized protein n=1 Tax=Cyprideis torosa TaxID=163714 RepID=A0A7R8W3W1_9CRUS|nr:unnamed protein product [Cyprideis torosa]CAG0881299.1 unnamed protein product [Cyprideis torosa]